MPRYARETTVPVEKSKAEIEATVGRYGATEFMSGWDRDRAIVGFKADGRFVRFDLPLPDRDAKEFTHYRHGGGSFLRERTEEGAGKLWEQACRQRWRALALCIKAKLEAVDCGITTFEEEFLAHIVLPGGAGTVYGFMRPQLAAAYETGEPPRMLPMLEAAS